MSIVGGSSELDEVLGGTVGVVRGRRRASEERRARCRGGGHSVREDSSTHLHVDGPLGERRLHLGPKRDGMGRLQLHVDIR